MSLDQQLFTDLESELAITRRTLEALPNDRMDYTPHAKSMKLGALAHHVADLPSFGAAILTQPEFDFASVPQSKPENLSTESILAHFDKQAELLRNAFKSVDTSTLNDEWTLRAGDHVIAKENRYRFFRMFAISHIVHHRAQLGTYLRLLDLPVPSVYGPSADS